MSHPKRLEMLDKMIASGNVDPFVHYARAMELRSLGERDDALAAFVGVTTRFPDYVPTYLIGGQLAVELARTEQARELLERGIVVAGAAGDGKALSELKNALAELD